MLSVIICTDNRENEFRRALSSIRKQSRKPDEIVVVDDGNLNATQVKISPATVQRRWVAFSSPRLVGGEKKQVAASDRWQVSGTFSPKLLNAKDFKGIIYIKKPETIGRGLTKSRNLGIKYAKGDTIMFLDDDVVLGKDYIKEIMKIFDNDKEKRVGGVGGYITNNPHRKKRVLNALFQRIFLLNSKNEGKIVASGFCTSISKLNSLKKVQRLSGCNMCYRKEVFKNFKFDEDMHIGLAEDYDFSYRVSKKYDLILTPFAKLQHLKSESRCKDYKELGFRQIYWHNRFFRKNMKKTPVTILAFIWSHLGILLLNTIAVIWKPSKTNRDRLIGNLKALFYFKMKRNLPQCAE